MQRHWGCIWECTSRAVRRERVWDQVKSLNPIWIRSNQLFLAPAEAQLENLVPGTGDAAVEPSEPEEASERQEAIRAGWVEALSETK